MYDELQKITGGKLTPFDYTKLNELSKSYSEKDIITIYKKYGYKPINYIEKILLKTPVWLRKDIVNQPIDNETKDIFTDFNSFIEGFRNEEV